MLLLPNRLTRWRVCVLQGCEAFDNGTGVRVGLSNLSSDVDDERGL